LRNHDAPSSSSGWVETRTGLGSIAGAVLNEPMPGGARWRHVFGPALAASFLIQLVTGILLLTAYVPSAGQAWGSVWYIQNQLTLGWFIRGLHHWGSSAMMVLLLLHMIQVVFTAAYRAPREVNWWLGLGMAGLVIAFSLTGYLLPWDQKGFWATKVATNIAGSSPGIGPQLLTFLVGGPEYGQATLSRLFGLHVGVLPLTLLVMAVLHVLLYYRHGATPPSDASSKPAEPAWPGQWFRHLAAIAVTLGVLGFVVWWNHGANLEAPADPSNADFPARPEWYFLSLFQMLNHMVSPYEILGTHVGPTILALFLAALPLLDRILPRKPLHVFACLVMVMVVVGAGALTAEAVIADANNEAHQLARARADVEAARASKLAAVEGVPPDGAIYLLRRDPQTRGVAVLNESCLGCHAMDGRTKASRLEFALTQKELDAADVSKSNFEGLTAPAVAAIAAKMPGFQPMGRAEPGGFGRLSIAGRTKDGEKATLGVSPDGLSLVATVMAKQTAADLKGVASRDWVRGLLEDPSSPRFFGPSPSLKGMKTWKKGSKLDAKGLDDVADFVARLAEVNPGETFTRWYDRAFAGKLENHPGLEPFKTECGKCHLVGDAGAITDGGDMEAPNLFRYGSREWLKTMIAHPEDEDFYGFLDDTERMPGFADRLPGSDLDVVVRYLMGENPAP
jgi:quinol-cytochrome oxidoreductase complex cytochrome b subunit